MPGDWISIWAIAQEQWPQKPRFYASRLLNYAILHDLPRQVGDVSAAIGGDPEKLYNISVNSPNVDRISREVFLNHSLMKSHIESRRFNAEERYLPRRPRQEEYLLNEPTTPVTYIPVGDGTQSEVELRRLSYFNRMGIPYGVLKKKGIPVAIDFKLNLIVDREAAALKEVSRKHYAEDALELPGGAEPPSKLGSINSEEALLWNVFRFLLRENGLKYFLTAETLYPAATELAPEERISGAWFWGMNDRGTHFMPLSQASEQIGDAAEKPTVPGLVLLGINHFMMIEGRFGSTLPTCPFLKNEQCPGTAGCGWWQAKGGIPSALPTFVERNDIQRTCGRHFHLTRLYLLMKAMSTQGTLGTGVMVVLIDEHQEAGQLNKKLFMDFLKNVPAEDHHRFFLTSWQKIRERLPLEPRFEELQREMREKWGL
ncbi:MAG: hypothetical protein ACKO6N_13065 [Myxococcota bacterium]